MKTLDFAVITSREVMYHKQVLTISSINDKGPFDVLPGHINFISLIHTVVHVQEDRTKRRDIAIRTGVMHVSQDTVRVYLGFGEKGR